MTSFASSQTDIQRAKALATRLGGPLLGLDSSSASTSICLISANGVSERLLPAASLPSESVVDTIAVLLREQELRVAHLKAMAVSLGPGSFTGLRVGLATVKGLALGSQVPVFGASSLATLAATSGPGWAMTVLDARRDEIFAALYNVVDGVAQPLIADCVVSLAAWKEAVASYLAQAPGQALTCVGDMAAACSDWPGVRVDDSVTPSALACVLQCASAMESGSAPPLASLVPRYLRLSEAERQLAAKS